MIRCELYKNVGGVFTADPKVVPEARLISEISYEEMLEMAGSGSKVVNPNAVEYAWRYGVELFITSLSSYPYGTLISSPLPASIRKSEG